MKRRDFSGRYGPKTLLEVLGKRRLVVEHHRGICCYAPEEISIKTTYGLLRIQGRGLTLCCMSREQLCIMGTIDTLTLEGRESDGALEQTGRNSPA